MKNSVLRLLTISCPQLPHNVAHMCSTCILTLCILAATIQLSAVLLQAIGVLNYGPYYRLAESAFLLLLSLPMHLYQKKKGKYSYLVTAICSIIIMLGYFEIVIYYNEPEEGLLFYAIIGTTSLAFIDFLKYFWSMILYSLLMTLYVYLRFLFTKGRTNIFSYYDCGYYITMSTITYCFLFYLFSKTLSFLVYEKSKADSILFSWKLMMRIVPIGIIIKSNNTILFYNEKAKLLLESENLSVTCDSLNTINSTYVILSHDESTITFQTPKMKHIYYNAKSIQFEEKDAEIIILNDISKVIECQNRINEQQMMEMFVATSTHELRTPLHCIKSTLEMIKDELKESNEFVDRAISACEMQELYINDMLDYAKLKKNSISLTLEPVNVNELITDCANYFILNAKENDIYLKAVVPDCSTIINADYLRMKQILFNLISNSLKFTKKGGITLRAFTESMKAYIEVEDTGIGIEEQDIPKLYKPFSMLLDKKAQNKSGTGLGLYLCKQLCTLMSGEISLKSIPHVRTIFTLSFSQLPADLLGKPQLSFRSKECSTEEASAKYEDGMKALVVDDNNFNCKILTKMLSSLKIESFYALSGQKALDIVKQNDTIKLAFIDLNMPFMDGYELLEEMQNLYLSRNDVMTIKAYAVSGDSSDSTKEKCKLVGFNGLLSKPFSKQQLASVLHEAGCSNEKYKYK